MSKNYILQNSIHIYKILNLRYIKPIVIKEARDKDWKQLIEWIIDYEFAIILLNFPPNGGNQHINSDVVGEQKSGSGWVWGLLFGFRSGSGINISGISPLGFWCFGVF